MFNYAETFASFTPGNGNNTAGTLNNDWQNSSTSTHSWFVATSTQSNGTGPSADHSPGDANFIYVESSGNFRNQTAIINTPCYNFSGLVAPKFSFWYHMFGNQMGELHVDLFNGNRWVLDVTRAIIGDQGNNWLYREVDLTAYAGTIVQLRFRGIVGNGFRSDIAIDDVEIVEPIADELTLVNFVTPTASSCNGSATEFVTVEIENLGSRVQDTIPLAYQVNGATVVRDTAFFNLTPGASFNHTFQVPFNMSASGTYNLSAWLELVNDGKNSNDSVVGYQVTTNSIQTNFPDTVTFDNFVVGTPGVFLNDWSNDPQNRFDWFVNVGNTPSAQTGPSGDTTSPASSGKYVYYEATNTPQGEQGSFYSGCLDLGSTNRPELKFFYHMLGIEMGELHLDVSLNGFLIQDIIPAITGDQGNAWIERTVDLTPYKGDVRIIFRAVRGTGFRSDIAVDQISLRDALPVGITDNNSKEVLTVFPNPTNDIVKITTSTTMDIVVFNSVGAVVKEQKVTKGTSQIDVSTWSNGVYFIKVLNGENSTVQKLIKR